MNRVRRNLLVSLFSLLFAISCLGHLEATAEAQAARQRGVEPSNAQLADRKIERRVDELLRQMTLAEKIGQLVQYSATEEDSTKPAGTSTAALKVNPPGPNGVDSFKLARSGRLGSMLNTVGQEITNHFQHAAVDHTRLHIPLLFGADVIHGFRTIFPVPLGTAASWDPELISSLAHMAALEAKTAGVQWFYSPMVDIARDARWGRCTEGAGEDPYLGAAIARAYIRGYQGDDLSATGSVAASVKHFAAYGAAEAGREYNTTDMSEIPLRQVYLPPYRAAVEAGAATVMSAFNALNSAPASANRFLLQTLLRDEWGFDGPVVSDYTAVMELIHHGIALDAATATAKALNAGVDIDMMSHFYDVELPALVKSGAVSIATVDEAVRRVLRLKFALGLFEHPFTTGPEVTNAVPENRGLARRAAEESFVLLKNTPTESPLLPLQKNKSIALIGPLADDSPDMVGAWSGANNFGDVVTLRAALAQRAQQNGTTLTYAKGTEISGDSEAGFGEAPQYGPERRYCGSRAWGIQRHERRGSLARLPQPARQSAEASGGDCCNRQTGGSSRFFRASSGAELGRLPRSGNHGGLVFGCGSRPRHCPNAVRRRFAKRQIDHELPAGRRPGAALLRSVSYRSPGAVSGS